MALQQLASASEVSWHGCGVARGCHWQGRGAAVHGLCFHLFPVSAAGLLKHGGSSGGQSSCWWGNQGGCRRQGGRREAPLRQGAAVLGGGPVPAAAGSPSPTSSKWANRRKRWQEVGHAHYYLTMSNLRVAGSTSCPRNPCVRHRSAQNYFWDLPGRTAAACHPSEALWWSFTDWIPHMMRRSSLPGLLLLALELGLMLQFAAGAARPPPRRRPPPRKAPVAKRPPPPRKAPTVTRPPPPRRRGGNGGIGGGLDPCSAELCLTCQTGDGALVPNVCLECLPAYVLSDSGSCTAAPGPSDNPSPSPPPPSPPPPSPAPRPPPKGKSLACPPVRLPCRHAHTHHLNTLAGSASNTPCACICLMLGCPSPAPAFHPFFEQWSSTSRAASLGSTSTQRASSKLSFPT